MNPTHNPKTAQIGLKKSQKKTQTLNQNKKVRIEPYPEPDPNPKKKPITAQKVKITPNLSQIQNWINNTWVDPKTFNLTRNPKIAHLGSKKPKMTPELGQKQML